VIEFNQIYNTATEVINSLAASRGFIEPNTTVCVIYSKTGRVYNGVSQNEVHAEVNAIRNMQGMGENGVDTIILVDAASRRAMLPCFNCLNYIISVNPVNSGAFIAMPDRPVPFQEILSQNPLGFGPAPQPRMFGNSSVPHSSVVISGRSNGDLMNGKINSLLAAAQTDESDEDKELLEELANEKKKKGLFGGLFGKK
jgi:cytidine deaminase